MRDISQSDLDKIENWDVKDTFGLIDFVRDRYTWPDWGFVEVWGNEGKKPVLHLTIHTGNWLYNEQLVTALLNNKLFKALYYEKWKAGGHHYFIIRPHLIGYRLVNDLCREIGCSRQYIYTIRDRFDWVEVSHKKRLIRPLRKNETIKKRAIS